MTQPVNRALTWWGAVADATPGELVDWGDRPRYYLSWPSTRPLTDRPPHTRFVLRTAQNSGSEHHEPGPHWGPGRHTDPRVSVRGAAVTVAAACAALVSVGLAACLTASSPPLADRSDPAVRREETRAQELVEASDTWHDGAAWSCRVRVMRQEQATTWAWSFCESTTTAGKFANAARVDGETVRWPRDQPDWDADIRRDFPADLVQLAETGNNRFLASSASSHPDRGTTPVGGTAPPR